MAQQTEAQEFRALLERIDEKLDGERRARQNKELAKLRSVAATLDEAKTLRRNGGDPKAIWDKVSDLSEAITNVQEAALGERAGVAEKMSSGQSLKKTVREVKGDVALHLAILARCFELQDEFRVVELDYVLTTAPKAIDGHRLGLAEARTPRRAAVLERTTELMDQMDAAADTANKKTILHSGVANKVVAALNATALLIDDFHAPLGIKTDRGDGHSHPLARGPPRP